MENESEQHCNAKFDYMAPHGEVVVSTWDIWLGPTPHQALHKTTAYCLPYLAYHAVDLGLQHQMVRADVWCHIAGQLLALGELGGGCKTRSLYALMPSPPSI